MSVKSLLQLILFLLIFLILGGIYYLYFNPSPVDNQDRVSEDIFELSEQNLNIESNFDKEILETTTQKKEEVTSEKISKLKDDKYLVKNSKNNTDIKNKTYKTNKSLDARNLTKEIEYITSNKNGDIFKIIAKFGKTNIENSNILDLEIVNGIVSSEERSTIYISSDFANYNYTDQNSKFFNNVRIDYDDKIITCDTLDLLISDNLAVAYNNVIIKDNNSVMKAQIITLDIVTKDIKINSEDKIKITTNTN